MGSKLFNFPIDDETKRLLRQIAKLNDQSRAAVIRTLIRREAKAQGIIDNDDQGQGQAAAQPAAPVEK